MADRPDYRIGTPDGAAYFSIDKLSQQLEYQIEYDLVMPLGLIVQFVGDTGKKARKRVMKASTSPSRNSRVNLPI